jgi:hypothetical protein
MSSPTPGGPSNFDMRQADETWVNFNRLAKWTIILTIILLAGMALFLTGSHPPKL